MNTEQKGRNPRRWAVALLAAVLSAGLVWGLLSNSGLLEGQSTDTGTVPAVSPVFTPAHSSLGQAVQHFFSIRPEPVQPIAYTHKVHLEQADVTCDFCHEGVTQGPVAKIPSVKTCMFCHEYTALENPEVQKVRAYFERGEEIPWQRVYGWNEEAHVRFNHAPHIRAEVECSTCHGDVAQMTVAERVVDHSMGFCMDCHEQQQASLDCLTCHY